VLKTRNKPSSRVPETDTIFALSSGALPAAIAVIRISGPAAFEAVRQLAGRVPSPRKASLATLRDPADGDVLDQALMLVFPGPNSATGEDLAELHLHGGRAVVRRVEAVLAEIAGLRQAISGEFTRRAFLHNRLDLNQVEGLSDLLTAETEWQRRTASAMMSGAFGRAVEEWRVALLAVSALVEAELDFADEDDVDVQNKHNISERCLELRDAMTALLAAPPAEKLRDGLRVVLGGPPNSGKSTLLNALVSRDAAIVSDIAGTTRDVIEVPVAMGGIPLIFTDTAGVRDDYQDAIEKIGIARAVSAFVDADILLWLGDERSGPNHPVRIELDAKADDGKRIAKSESALPVSARSGLGMLTLIALIIERAKTLLPPEDSFAVNTRQRTLIAVAVDELKMSANEDDWLIVGEHLRLARLALDALSGRAHTEDMLDSLFSRFCVGK
jgi:tRNA modification GTPase